MSDALTVPEVPIEKLRWRCDPSSLPFETTDDLTPLEGMLGQERAQKALNLGVEIAKSGYNIYVCGMTGTGRMTAVHQILEAQRKEGKPAPDLCYVSRFQQPEQPRLLILPTGHGRVLKQAMEGVVKDLKREMPQVLTSQDLRQRTKARMQEAQRREARLCEQLEAQLTPDFGLFWHQADAGPEPELAPLLDGQLVPLSELDQRLEAGTLSVEQYRHLHARHRTLLVECRHGFDDIRRLRQEAEEEVHKLERAHVRPLIEKHVQEAAAAFGDESDIQDYFRDVVESLIEHSGRFIPAPPAVEGHGGGPSMPHPGDEEETFHEYQVNVLVDNADADGPPVIFETAPTYRNLFGSIEPVPEYGGIWRVDFSCIRSGSLHRAHGGYLVFNAFDALSDPMVWPVLKRVLRYGQADIQAHDHSAFMPGGGLKPDPLPCNVKVIMLGDEELYEALAFDDESFTRLFKVKADFDTVLPRNAGTMAQYADFLRRVCDEEQLRPCDRSAVAALLEYGVRLAGRQNKLSARLEYIADVVREADYWASKSGAAVVTRELVAHALHEREARVSMAQEQIQEFIDEELLLVSAHGTAIGQVNGLVIYETSADYGFGCPVRITASTAMGDAGVVNIEREVALSDATHHKGVLILTGYLRNTYAYDKPIVLSASLCVEQSYEGISGDSATAAECYALLSSLAGLPVEQGIAITGSVNQKGVLQAVSGINEKIEGFFDTCHRQGLTGCQGVVIPSSNIADLMLREDVIEAIVAKQFHVYAIQTLDEGWPILTGLAAGVWQPEIGYPPDTVHGRVEAQLRRFAEQWYALQNGMPYQHEPRYS
jgi:lon-related putative ATP-dependent protease